MYLKLCSKLYFIWKQHQQKQFQTTTAITTATSIATTITATMTITITAATTTPWTWIMSQKYDLCVDLISQVPGFLQVRICLIGFLLRQCERRNIPTFLFSRNLKHGIFHIYGIYHVKIVLRKFCEKITKLVAKLARPKTDLKMNVFGL
jgi:hypothetical protein